MVRKGDTKDMYDHLDRRQVAFTSLRLLGFEADVMQKQHHTPFNKNMFDMQNKRCFEIVFHFLFKRFNPAMCRDQFAGCWPIRDKSSEQQFRKTCLNWLLAIAKEVPELHFPRVSATLFMAPGGEKFMQLFFAFTNFVLLHVMQRENGVKLADMIKCPQLTSTNANLAPAMCTVPQATAIQKRRDFFKHTTQLVEAQRLWKEYAQEVVKEDRRLTKDIKEVETDVRKEAQHAAALADKHATMRSMRRGNSGAYDAETEAVRRAHTVSEVRALWHKLTTLYTSTQEGRDMVMDLIEYGRNRHVIDAADIPVQVPDVLLRECEEAIHQRQIENTYEGGKLNLLSLVQLWNLSLYMYRDKLQKVGLGAVEPHIPNIATKLHMHAAHLTNAKSLCKALEDKVIPDLKANISRLRATLNRVPLPSPKTPLKANKKFSLMVNSPMVSFSPKPNPDERGQSGATHSVLPSPNIETTPEAISRLLDSVKSKTTRNYTQDNPSVSSTPSRRTKSECDLISQIVAPNKPSNYSFKSPIDSLQSTPRGENAVTPLRTELWRGNEAVPRHFTPLSPGRYNGGISPYTLPAETSRLSGGFNSLRGGENEQNNSNLLNQSNDLLQQYNQLNTSLQMHNQSNGVLQAKHSDMVQYNRLNNASPHMNQSNSALQQLNQSRYASEQLNQSNRESQQFNQSNDVSQKLNQSNILSQKLSCAHNILADKIVDAAMGDDDTDIIETYVDTNLADPIKALDDSVFLPKDKISRTPTISSDNPGSDYTPFSPISVMQLRDMNEHQNTSTNLNTSYDAHQNASKPLNASYTIHQNTSYSAHQISVGEKINSHTTPNGSFTLIPNRSRNLSANRNINNNSDNQSESDTDHTEILNLEAKFNARYSQKGNSSTTYGNELDSHMISSPQINKNSHSTFDKTTHDANKYHSNENAEQNLTYDEDTRDVEFNYLQADKNTRPSNTILQDNENIVNSFLREFNDSNNRDTSDDIPIEIVEQVSRNLVPDLYDDDKNVDGLGRSREYDDSEKENSHPLIADILRTPRIGNEDVPKETSPLSRTKQLSQHGTSPKTSPRAAQLSRDMSNLITDNETSLLHLEQMFKSFQSTSLNNSRIAENESINLAKISDKYYSLDNSRIARNDSINLTKISDKHYSLDNSRIAENHSINHSKISDNQYSLVSRNFDKNTSLNTSKRDNLVHDLSDDECLDDEQLPDFNGSYVNDTSPKNVSGISDFDIQREASIHRISSRSKLLLDDSLLNISHCSGHDATFEKTPQNVAIDKSLPLNKTFDITSPQNIKSEQPVFGELPSLIAKYSLNDGNNDVVSDLSQASSIANINDDKLFDVKTLYQKNYCADVDNSEMSDHNESFSPETKGLTYTATSATKSQTNKPQSSLDAIRAKFLQITQRTDKNITKEKPQNLPFTTTPKSPFITKEFLPNTTQNNVAESPLRNRNPALKTYSLSPFASPNRTQSYSQQMFSPSHQLPQTYNSLPSPQSVQESSLRRHFSPSSHRLDSNRRYTLGLDQEDLSFLVPSSP